jgi:hypothetical protein
MKPILNGRRIIYKTITLIITVVILITLSTQMRASSDTCAGVNVNLPFEDITGNSFFCQIAAAYFAGLTNGTSATTYSPSAPVAREQMAAFVTRTLDQSLKRSNRRGALDQWWTAKNENSIMQRRFFDGSSCRDVRSDGKDLWATAGGRILRIDAASGRSQGSYLTNEDVLNPVLMARGYVYVAGGTTVNSHNLYELNPSQPAGTPGDTRLVTNNLGNLPRMLAFDGRYIWCTNESASISIIDPANNFSVTTKPLGVSPHGILFDGKNIWITDRGTGDLLRMNASGFIIQTLPLGGKPGLPIFDGTNIWVPNTEGKVHVVRASSGILQATLQTAELQEPYAAAFDGEQVAVTDLKGSVHVWKATDFTYQGSLKMDEFTAPIGICSDGTRFWVAANKGIQDGLLFSF